VLAQGLGFPFLGDFVAASRGPCVDTRPPGPADARSVAPAGGLIETMHAVGATGIFQAVECLWQLQQKYDKFHGDPKIWKKWGKEKPKDWQSLQIHEDSKQALWVSHAGVGSHVTVGILRKSW